MDLKDEETIEDAIGFAVGWASMCWNPIPTGRFDDQEATKVVAELLKYVNNELQIEHEKRVGAEERSIRLANQLINEIPGSYIEMKERALKAEEQVRATRYLYDTLKIEQEIYGMGTWRSYTIHLLEPIVDPK